MTTAIAGSIKPPTLNERIDRLHELRLRIADATRELTARELHARELRAQLERELHRGNKAEAEKFAKADPRYLDFERATAQLAHTRDEGFADAEALRLEILATIYQAEQLGEGA